MPTSNKSSTESCEKACSLILKFMDNKSISANSGVSTSVFQKTDGFRYINIFVQFEQTTATEAGVDLGVIFAFSSTGELGSRHYVNFTENLASPQPVNFVNITGEGSWHGSPHNTSSYIARFPVMGPYVQVFPFNKHNKARKVSIRGYLTS